MHIRIHMHIQYQDRPPVKLAAASKILLLHGGGVIQASVEGLPRSVELLEMLEQDGPNRVFAEREGASLLHLAPCLILIEPAPREAKAPQPAHILLAYAFLVELLLENLLKANALEGILLLFWRLIC